MRYRNSYETILMNRLYNCPLSLSHCYNESIQFTNWAKAKLLVHQEMCLSHSVAVRSCCRCVFWNSIVWKQITSKTKGQKGKLWDITLKRLNVKDTCPSLWIKFKTVDVKETWRNTRRKLSVHMKMKAKCKKLSADSFDSTMHCITRHVYMKTL